MLDRLPFLQPEGSNFRLGPLKKIRGRIFLGSGVEFWLFRLARHTLLTQKGFRPPGMEEAQRDDMIEQGAQGEDKNTKPSCAGWKLPHVGYFFVLLHCPYH